MNNETLGIKAFLAAVCDALGNGIRAEALIQAVADTLPTDVESAAAAFESMLAEGLITEAADGKGISLSPTGKSAAKEFAALLYETTRKDGVPTAVRAYAAYTGGARYEANVEKTEDGYSLVCGEYRGQTAVSEVRLCFDTERAAYAAKKHFDAAPDTLCDNIRAMVTGDMGYLL